MHVTVSHRLEGIGEYYFSSKLREIDELNKAGKGIINLGIGSPDLPPHPDVIKILQEEAEAPVRRPRATALRSRAAGAVGGRPRQFSSRQKPAKGR